MTREDRPVREHPDTLHASSGARRKSAANFVEGKSLYVVDVDTYELHRSMAYALGAQSVSNKMLAHVNVVLHGERAAPEKTRAKYPKAEYVPAKSLLPLFHQEVDSFGAFVKALQKHGFRVRNPSDEGDPAMDFFTLPLKKRSLHETLLDYLTASDFIRGFVREPYHPVAEPDATYVALPVQGKAGALTWYYQWQQDAWRRVYAQRGDGDHPLELKGEQLLTVAPVLWTRSTGLYFHAQPHIDSVSGLFIQAGIDARSGDVNGVAISRVWT